MKIKIEDGGYNSLLRGERVTCKALNDNVSTTRHDINGKIHRYEDRHSLMHAFLAASKARRVTVVSQANCYEITATVCGIGDISIGGISFFVDLKPLETAKSEE